MNLPIMQFFFQFSLAFLVFYKYSSSQPFLTPLNLCVYHYVSDLFTDPYITKIKTVVSRIATFLFLDDVDGDKKF